MDEDEIAQVIIEFQHAGFPITVPKLRILAWQYDHLNSINSFANNKEKKRQARPGQNFSAQVPPHKGMLCRKFIQGKGYGSK